MTTPFNAAGDSSQVGVQAKNAYFESVTFPGDVQLTIGRDTSPANKYRVGVDNLKSGDPRTARRLIWEAMMDEYEVSGEVLFHWLVAMLSGRTVRQFSTEEIDQLKHSRSRYAEIVTDEWTDGIQLIYQLLDSVPLLLARESEHKATKTDMSRLIDQVNELGEKQRDMIRPHLELFLTGPLQNETWQRELQHAQSRQFASDRMGRAWMFFQAIPAEVLLPQPFPARIRAVDRMGMHISGYLSVLAIGYLGWELFGHRAFLGLLAYIAAIAGGRVAASADLEFSFLTERRRAKEDQFHVPSQLTSRPPSDELTGRVDKLFNRYFDMYEPDKTEREHWKAAVAGHRRFYQDEIIAACRSNGTPANEVTWLIRYQVRQLKQRWQHETLDEYRRRLQPRLSTVATRWGGFSLVIIGVVWSIVALRIYLLADTVALLGAFLTWRCWRRVSLECRRWAADREEHARRQTAINKEFIRWSEKLKARPKDEDMAAWLGSDRTVLLGNVLDHFQLSRSRLVAHAFLEKPKVAARRAQIEGGPWRYAGYQLTVFLLAEEGVRVVRASLEFMTGKLIMRERTSYRYDSIVSVHSSRERQQHSFELRLAAGEPILVRVQSTDPIPVEPDGDVGPMEETAAEEEDTAVDVTSLEDLMHMLERAAGEGQNWFRGRGGEGVWLGNNPPTNIN